MLNRLYIVIGVLAILAIAGAFAIPMFVDEAAVRAQVEKVASESLGQPVTIAGEVSFSVLPQPSVILSDARVGDPAQPLVTVDEVHAELSLFDFLRDHYLITRLRLVRPVLEVRVDEAGNVATGLGQAASGAAERRVTLSSTEISDGRLRGLDARSGTVVEVANIAGVLQTAAALNGPFTFQGAGRFEGVDYEGRLAASALDADGVMSTSLFVEAADGAFSFGSEGYVVTGDSPSYSGTATYRQRPPAVAEDADGTDAGRGELLVTSEVRADTARVLFDTFTLTPDENRPSARLSGTADIQLGASNRFGIVILNGIASLPPRDATADPSTVPFELIRQLSELPAVPVPPMPGEINLSISELGLRDVSLRDVRMDATTDGRRWIVDGLEATLPGGTQLRLAGSVETEDGKPGFRGEGSLESVSLHSLAQLWRRPASGNPLVNVPGSLAAKLILAGDTLSVSDGELTIGDAVHPFSAEIGFASATRHLNLRSSLGDLDRVASDRLLAFLPDLGADGRFGVTFPKGRFDLAAEGMTLAGVDGDSLAASGFWEGGVLALEAFSAADYGGVGLDASLTAFGTLARPELSGAAHLSIGAAGAPALDLLFDAVRAPSTVRAWLGRSLPAELDVQLAAPSGEGGQSLSVSGTAGAVQVTAEAALGVGIARALEGSITLRLELASDGGSLVRQLGISETALTTAGEPARAVAVVSGTAANSFEVTLRLEGGNDSLAFAGNVVAGDLSRPSGNGTLQLALADASGLVESIGAGGLWLPPVNGSARVDFEGLDQVRLSEISGAASGVPFSGALEWTRSEAESAVSGTLNLAELDASGFLFALAGTDALEKEGGGFWPNGPAQLGDTARETTGRITVRADALTVASTPVGSEAAFDLVWDQTSARVRAFSAAIGEGEVTAELSVCCAGPLAQKQVSGRLGLDNVRIGGIAPVALGDAIGARVEAAARFSGTGNSLASAMSAMTGEGTYTLSDLAINGLNAKAFNALSSFDAVLRLEPSVVTALVRDRADDGRFLASTASGSFTIAGGVIRSSNLAIEGEGARLFGDANLDLSDLSLSGGFAMSPTVPSGPENMLTAANSQITARLGGTLTAPERSFDVSGMVDAIMVRAFEIEVARLERLRAEDEARQRAAAEERARIAAEEAARQAAEEEARRAAEEARLAAEAEERRRAEEAAAAEAAQQEPQLQPGFNLNFEPSSPNLF